MLATPRNVQKLEYDVTHSAAEEVSSRWWVPLLHGMVLIVAGVLIFSIDWGIDSLSAFIGALFIVEGVSSAMTPAVDRDSRRTNYVIGFLSIASGIAIIAWPGPGLVVVSVFLGAWLIVMGTTTIAGAFAAREVVPNWWMWLILGLLEIPLGVLALADPGATLAALVTVAGIWAVTIGVIEVILAFEIRHLPRHVDEAFGVTTSRPRSDAGAPASTATMRVPDATATGRPS
jgi:uncharacterized membrane protein HdeD (DUF308 family)